MSAASDITPAVLLRSRPRSRWRERAIHGSLALCALLSIATTTGIIVILATETWAFFEVVSVADFLFGREWTPLIEPRSFGVLPLVCGTLMIVVGSSLLAIPVGLATAFYLSELAGDRARRVVKPILEVLAGIPTVVFGFFALMYVTPLLRHVFPSIEIFNAASGCIVVGVMILPMVTSLCDDAFRAVPRDLRDAAYAVGATHAEVSTRIVLPGALSGVVAAVVLAISRAIGETMAVALAAGATPRMTLDPRESIQTMTSYIVQVAMGDTPAGTVEYRTLFAVGALLFSITLVANLVAHRFLKKHREVYA